MRESESPLFIVGTERSGSNLLRLMLNAHSRIAVPHPPHIVRYFAPLESAYGNLTSSQRAFATLVDDILGLVRRHIYPWELAIDRARLIREARPRDSLGVTAALYDQYRDQAGKARWGCKSTFMIHYVDRVLERFPNARLIFLTRDPRDVAVSSRHSVFNPYHPYFTAQLWAEQQRIGLDLLNRLSRETILHVRYEDLITRPGETTARFCEFLNESCEASMLRYFETAEARKSASLSRSWRNTDREIMSANFGKYRQELSLSEVRLVESITRSEMESLGYQPESNVVPLNLSSWQLWSYRLLDWTRRWRVEWQSLWTDRNHWRRWHRDLFVRYLRLVRRPRHRRTCP
jgi:hypothetical protein